MSIQCAQLLSWQQYIFLSTNSWREIKSKAPLSSRFKFVYFVDILETGPEIGTGLYGYHYPPPDQLVCTWIEACACGATVVHYLAEWHASKKDLVYSQLSPSLVTLKAFHSSADESSCCCCLFHFLQTPNQDVSDFLVGGREIFAGGSEIQQSDRRAFPAAKEKLKRYTALTLASLSF